MQQKYRDVEIFGGNLRDFSLSNFDGLPKAIGNATTLKCINELISNSGEYKSQDKKEFNDSFQPIIDLPNFLLIVLKLTRMEERDFKPTDFNLDDKELINEFDEIGIDEKFVKQFAFNLLKAKYLLDNYIVHHANEDDTFDSNPWKLQRWLKDGKSEYLENLDGKSDEQETHDTLQGYWTTGSPSSSGLHKTSASTLIPRSRSCFRISRDGRAPAS